MIRVRAQRAGDKRGFLKMRYLYLDNFRGFSKTSVPLEDVNFLVGENSSGKTSLLSALRMFASSELLYGAEGMPIPQLQIGDFAELVSAHSADQKHFTLGFIAEGRLGKEPESRGMLLTYRNDDGLARIARLTCSMINGEVSLSLEGNKIFYEVKALAPSRTIDAMHKRLLEWASNHAAPRGQNWSHTKLPSHQPAAALPLFMVLSLAFHKTKKRSKEAGDEVGFSVASFAPAPIVWIAPIRSEPRRTYDALGTLYSPEGSHTPYVIRRLLKSRHRAARFKEFMQRVGEASGLFQKIDIRRLGKSAHAPFEVDAYLDGVALNLSWVGYGVSQSLPIFVELLDRPKGSWFAIQQPEVHLHPRAQACLGDLFYEMATLDNKQFVVETHSDFTIDRFRMNYRRRRPKKENEKIPKGQILFFERHNRMNTVTSLPIDQNGTLPEDQPESYRRFFIKEEMRLLGLS